MVQLLTIREVSQRIGAGRTKLYQLLSQGELPKPVKIGTASRWLDVEIEEFINKKAAERF